LVIFSSIGKLVRVNSLLSLTDDAESNHSEQDSNGKGNDDGVFPVIIFFSWCVLPFNLVKLGGHTKLVSHGVEVSSFILSGFGCLSSCQFFVVVSNELWGAAELNSNSFGRVKID